MNDPDARFSEKPFSNRHDHRFIYWSRSHVMAVGALHDAVETAGGLTVLHGLRGTGKSMLVRRFAVDVAAARPIRYYRYPVPEDLQWAIERAENPPATRGPETMLSLRKTVTSEEPPVCLVDQADHAPANKVERLCELAEAQKLSLILIRSRDLSSDAVAAPDDLAVRSIHLEPLCLVETQEYIAHRLIVAGRDADLFSAAAVKRIHGLSFGIPRNVNAVCNLCLFNFPDVREVTEGLVEEIARTARERGCFPRFLRQAEAPARRRLRRSSSMLIRPAGTLSLPEPSAQQEADPPSVGARTGKTVLFERGPVEQRTVRPAITDSAVAAVNLLQRGLSGGRRTSMALALIAVCAVGLTATVTPLLAKALGSGETTAAVLRASPISLANASDGGETSVLGPLASVLTAREAPLPTMAAAGVDADVSPRVLDPTSSPHPDLIEREVAEIIPDASTTVALHYSPTSEGQPAPPELSAEQPQDRQPDVFDPQPPAPAGADARAVTGQREAISLLAKTLRDFTGWDGLATATPSTTQSEAGENATVLAARAPQPAEPVQAEPAATQGRSSSRTRLVIHHSAADRQRARALIVPLERRGFRPELRAVPHSISRDQVRYFSRDDLVRARQVVGVLAGHDTSADLRDFSDQALDLDYSLLEVWLSN